MRNKYLFWIALAIVVGSAVGILIVTSGDKPDQSFSTTVSVESGIVEVRSEGKTRRVEAGEEVVVSGDTGPVRVERAK